MESEPLPLSLPLPLSPSPPLSLSPSPSLYPLLSFIFRIRFGLYQSQKPLNDNRSKPRATKVV